MPEVEPKAGCSADTEGKESKHADLKKMTKKELWDLAVDLQEQVIKQRDEDQRLILEMAGLQKEWDAANQKLEETRAANAERERIKDDNWIRHQREIREWEERLKMAQTQHALRVAEQKMANFATKTVTLPPRGALSKIQAEKEERENTIKLLIMNFQMKHDMEMMELMEFQDMREREIITFYHTKMRMKAEETMMELQAEFEKIDLKYSKIIQQLSAEFDEAVLEAKKIYDETLEMMEEVERLKEELRKQKEVERMREKAQQLLKDLKRKIRSTRELRKHLPAKKKRDISEKLVDKILELMDTHVELMECENETRDIELDMKALVLVWRDDGLEKLEEQLAESKEFFQPLKLCFLPAVTEKDEAVAEKMKELITVQRNKRQALKKGVNQLLKEYDEVMVKTLAEGKIPPDFKTRKTYIIKMLRISKTLPLFKWIDQVLKEKARAKAINLSETKSCSSQKPPESESSAEAL